MKIVFFYPSYVVGGAEYLIIRLIEQLTATHQCYIVDFEGGIYRKLNNKLSDDIFIKFEQNFYIPEDAYIITYPSEIKRLSDNLNIQNKSNKIVFWAVHPDNFQSLIPLKRYLPNFILQYIFYPLIVKTIKILNNNNSLIAMDGGILERYKNLYGLDIQLPFCPIPVDVKENISCKIHEEDNKVRCVWLGRISVEKVYSLKKVLDDINCLNNVIVEFDIIGTGEYEYIIREFVSSPHLTINFLGTITERLDDVLINYDVCFAMGTSVLESAKLKIPSILVDGSYNELPNDYKYRWLYETNDYILGIFLPNQYSSCCILQMKDIFDLIKMKKSEIGDKCYQYVKEHHSLKNVSKRLIDYVSKSTLAVEDVRKLKVNNTVFHKIHKILKFLKGKMKK